jgi:uncharacterized protein (DUF4415 family)
MSEKPANKRRRTTSRTSGTDWKRVESLRDEDIDTGDIPEPTPEQFARAVAREGLEPVRRKGQITLRLDADVLDWFRAQGRGYQTQINALLRAYVEAHRSR